MRNKHVLLNAVLALVLVHDRLCKDARGTTRTWLNEESSAITCCVPVSIGGIIC